MRWPRRTATASRASSPRCSMPSTSVWVCTWTSEHLGSSRRSGRGLARVLREAARTDARRVRGGGRAPRSRAAPGRARPAPRARLPRRSPAASRRACTAGRSRRLLRDDQYFPIQGMYGSDVARRRRRALVAARCSSTRSTTSTCSGGSSATRSRVSARVASRFGYEGIDDVADVTLDYADGTLATLLSVWHQILTAAVDAPPRGVLRGRAALGRGRPPRPTARRDSRRRRRSIRRDPPAWIGRARPSRAVVGPLPQYAEPGKAFLDALAPTAGGPAPDAATALAAHRVVDAAYRSAGRRPAAASPADSRRRPALRAPRCLRDNGSRAAFRGRAADPPGDRGQPLGHRPEAGAAGLRHDAVPARRRG